MAEYIDKKAFKDKYLCCGYLPEMSEEEFDTFPTINTMTNEQALAYFKRRKEQFGLADIVQEAEDCAIKALEQALETGKIMKGKEIKKIGYIARYDLNLNPHSTERFKFRESTFTRRISSRGDRVYSKMLQRPVDYEEIVDNAEIMKKNPSLILVCEPFLLDDELRDKVTKWVEWANHVDPKEYDPKANESADG